jgi:hypothetical protein
MTFNVYGRARDDRMREVIERTAAAITPETDHALCVHFTPQARTKKTQPLMKTSSCAK